MRVEDDVERLMPLQRGERLVEDLERLLDVGLADDERGAMRTMLP